MKPRTHHEVRIAQVRHDNLIKNKVAKIKVKESEQATGIKGSCAFSRLKYFDVVRDYQLDGMHIFSNLVAQHHNAFLGGGWNADVRNCARRLNIYVRHLCGNLPSRRENETQAERLASKFQYDLSLFHISNMLCSCSFENMVS
jgi:hypothetical protein